MSKKRNRKKSNRNRRVCISYAPGHNVHWIQALRSANDEAVSAKTWPGKLVTVEGEVVTIRKPDDSLVRFRVHHPARLVRLLQHKNVGVTINDQFSIMRAGITRTGSTCISVKADKGEPLGPCHIGGLPPSATALDASGGDDD